MQSKVVLVDYNFNKNDLRHELYRQTYSDGKMFQLYEKLTRLEKGIRGN